MAVGLEQRVTWGSRIWGEGQLGLLHAEAEKRAARGQGNVDGERAGVSL